MEIVEVPAFHDSQLEPVLKKLNLWESVIKGEEKCYICDSKITLNNLGGIIRINGKDRLICESPHCITTAMKMVEGIKQR